MREHKHSPSHASLHLDGGADDARPGCCVWRVRKHDARNLMMHHETSEVRYIVSGCDAASGLVYLTSDVLTGLQSLLILLIAKARNHETRGRAAPAGTARRPIRPG